MRERERERDRQTDRQRQRGGGRNRREGGERKDDVCRPEVTLRGWQDCDVKIQILFVCLSVCLSSSQTHMH